MDPDPPEIAQFASEIHATSPDGRFRCGGARGDGLCSLWSVLITWSLLDRPNHDLNRNGHFFGLEAQPESLEDLRQLLLATCEALLHEGDLSLITCVEPWFTPPVWDIQALEAQLRLPAEQLQTIHGEAVFYLAAFLMAVEIHVLEKATGQVTRFGNRENDAIRISTDGSHYCPINPRDRGLHYFTNRKWWDLQWRGHPISEIMEPVL